MNGSLGTYCGQKKAKVVDDMTLRWSEHGRGEERSEGQIHSHSLHFIPIAEGEGLPDGSACPFIMSALSGLTAGVLREVPSAFDRLTCEMAMLIAMLIAFRNAC